MRQRFMITGLMLVMIMGFYSEFIYKPISRKNKKAALQIKKLEANIEELKVQAPDIEKGARRLTSLKGEALALEDEIKSLEKKLPGQADESLFLGELTRQANILNINFISIHQKIEKETGFDKLWVELRMKASYQDIVNYLNRIESISPYLAIQEMEIVEPKKESPAATDARLLISIPLVAPAVERGPVVATTRDSLEVPRDIFISRGMAEGGGAPEVKLEGITCRGKNSTVIINGDVFRIGDKVRDFVVKDILSNAVVLSRNKDEYVIPLTSK